MTFTIVGRCQRTGMLGIGTATNALCVGVKVLFIQRRVGAVAIMAIADERLGPMGLRLLEMGYRGKGVVDQLVSGDPFAEYRQLAVVDDDGHSYVRDGKENTHWTGHRCGDGYAVLGNAIAGEEVIDAMETEFLSDPDEDLEERLMRTVEAGRDAGGQPNGQRSAALLVYEDKTFSRVNLRVDIHSEPEKELRRIFDLYRPTIPYYNMRQVDPRVPGLDDWLTQQGKPLP